MIDLGKGNVMKNMLIGALQKSAEILPAGKPTHDIHDLIQSQPSELGWVPTVDGA